MTHFHKKASAKSGMLPGSPVYVGDEVPTQTKITVHIYDSASYRACEQFEKEAIEQALAQKKRVWVDIIGLKNNRLINSLFDYFSIHPLIAEDILNTSQRTKIEALPNGLFFVINLLDTAQDYLTYDREQFSMIEKQGVLLTFRETADYDLAPLYNRLQTSNSMVREHGVEYLSYLILDNIVDDYFNFVENTEEELAQMEDLLIADPAAISLKELYTIKRRTMELRKVIAPLRDIVHIMLSEHRRFISAEYNLYYRDLHDHCMRLVELIDLHREMSAGMLDIYLSAMNNQMSETMKILTLFASLFIPLTFIAGVYGMNFKYMPELEWHYGYPLVLGVMGLLAAGMLYFFKRKRLL